MSSSSSGSYHTPDSQPQERMIPGSPSNQSPAQDVDRLTDSFQTARLGPSSSSARESTMSTTPPNNGKGVSANTPVLKKQIPYMFEEFEKRPNKRIHDSKLGINIVVEANYFRLFMNGDLTIHVYNVEYSTRGRGGQVEMKRREETRIVFWAAVRQHQNVFPHHTRMAYNGVNLIYTLDTLRTDRGDIVLPVRMSDRVTVNMRIKYATPIRLRCDPQSIQDKIALISVLDEVCAARIRCPLKGDSAFFTQHGRSTFFVPNRNNDGWDKRLAIPIGEGLEVWTGLHGAVKPDCQLGMLINVDLGHSVFYRQQNNLVNFFVELVGRCAFEDKTNAEKDQLIERSLDKTGLNKHSRAMLDKALKGLSLNYTAPGGRSKIFKYADIANRASSVHQIVMRDGQRISIQEYYRQFYQYELRFPYLPCVLFNKTRGSWVPMEMVTTIEEPRRYRGKIPDGPLRRMVQRTAFPATERRELILQMAAANGENPNHPVFLAEQDEHMRVWSLREPRVRQGNKPNGQKDVVNVEHKGEWSLQNEITLRKCLGPKKSVVPMLIFMKSNQGSKERPDVQPLATLMETLAYFGFGVPLQGNALAAFSFNIENQRWDVIKEWIKEFKTRVASDYEGSIPLVLVLFEQKCTTKRQFHAHYFSEYAMIKYIGDVCTGVHTQCLLTKTYRQLAGKPLTCTTAQNVALKIMAKLGISLYHLERDGTHKNWTKFTDPENPTLVLGIDVTHSGEFDRRAGGHAALSVACVVGNINLNCSKFEASVRAQNVGEERTVSLTDEFERRICAFFHNTGKKPRHVVIYRDGVSESQFAEILHEEKESFKEACKKLYPEHDSKPTLTYIILNKRHHTRFFPTEQKDAFGNANNLKPGTLVKDDVTSEELFDFFLISHSGPLGTSRPGHYTVLHDEWRPSYAFWQTITHALAYSYVRCSKSVSQPAPVMYAHLAAKRAKDYLMAHYEVNGQRLSRMSDYEAFVDLRKHLHKHENLSGMLFV